MSQSGPRSGHWVMAAQPPVMNGPSDATTVSRAVNQPRTNHRRPLWSRDQLSTNEGRAWRGGVSIRAEMRLEISGPGSGLSLVTTITHQAPHRATRPVWWHAAWIIYCCASDVRVMKNAKLKQQWKYWCAILCLFGFILSYCNVRVLSQSAGCRIVIPCLEPQWINHHSHPATATSPAQPSTTGAVIFKYRALVLVPVSRVLPFWHWCTPRDGFIKLP